MANEIRISILLNRILRERDQNRFLSLYFKITSSGRKNTVVRDIEGQLVEIETHCPLSWTLEVGKQMFPPTSHSSL